MIEFVFNNWILITVVIVPALGLLWKAISDVIQGTAASSYESKPYALTASESVATAKAASIVYPGDRTEKEWKRELPDKANEVGLQLVHVVSSSGVDAALFEIPESNLLVISIRGTSGIWDVVRDGLAWRIKAPIQGTAHSQFLGDAKLLYYNLSLRSYVVDAKEQGMRVVVTGHSLGAATATEFAAVAEEDFQALDGILAICAPRSGNKLHAQTLTNTFGSRIIRLTFSRDLVCLVPPVIFGFRHVGQTHYFDCKEQYHPVLTAGFRFADLFGAAIKDIMKFRLFRNTLGYHSSVRVVELFEDNIERFPVKKTQPVVKELDMN